MDNHYDIYQVHTVHTGGDGLPKKETKGTGFFSLHVN